MIVIAMNDQGVVIGVDRIEEIATDVLFYFETLTLSVVLVRCSNWVQCAKVSQSLGAAGVTHRVSPLTETDGVFRDRVHDIGGVHVIVDNGKEFRELDRGKAQYLGTDWFAARDVASLGAQSVAGVGSLLYDGATYRMAWAQGQCWVVRRATANEQAFDAAVHFAHLTQVSANPPLLCWVPWPADPEMDAELRFAEFETTKATTLKGNMS